jgi:hypothetical protein
MNGNDINIHTMAIHTHCKINSRHICSKYLPSFKIHNLEHITNEPQACMLENIFNIP